ncbi:hypothetical protein H0H87_007159 [Tephrocybe sp. NHM501043]|nr:hypothetical protein H0H87_007159 [Tephrocybe sp. NHM501043]
MAGKSTRCRVGNKEPKGEKKTWVLHEIHVAKGKCHYDFRNNVPFRITTLLRLLWVVLMTIRASFRPLPKDILVCQAALLAECVPEEDDEADTDRSGDNAEKPEDGSPA